MKRQLKEHLLQQKRRRIKTRDLEDYILKKLGREDYWREGGYRGLAESLTALVEEEFLRPIKAWKKNGLSPSLYNGYQILYQDSLAKEEKKKLLASFHPLMNTTYFIDHPKEYRELSPYLNRLNTFLKENSGFQSEPSLTLNERSFQIFSDEKWLASSEGSSFLSLISLSYEDLNCYPTYEPFFYYQKRATEEVKGLIIENKDTFYSLKRLFLKGIHSFHQVDYNLLIFGEGNKINRSFFYYHELEQFRGLPSSFYYFGDLDPEGIRIWHRLKERAEEEILPGIFFYQSLLDYHQGRGETIKTQQKPLSLEIRDEFLSFFQEEYQLIIRDLLDKRRYLPQEGLHYLYLKEIADVEKRDH